MVVLVNSSTPVFFNSHVLLSIAIISVAHPGRYLSVGRTEGEALHTTTRPNEFSIWHLDAAHDVYYLATTDPEQQQPKHYVSSNRRGPFMTKHRRDWEEWKMERSPTGDITLWCMKHEKYLGCNSSGDVHTTSSHGNWCLWDMEESQDGKGIYLRSKSHQRLLSFDGTKLCTVEDQYTSKETWRLEPRLPASLSGPKLAALGAAGVVGIAVTVAMPYAVLGWPESGLWF